MNLFKKIKSKLQSTTDSEQETKVSSSSTSITILDNQNSERILKELMDLRSKNN